MRILQLYHERFTTATFILYIIIWLELHLFYLGNKERYLLMFGLLNTKRLLSGSSCQSISLPIMLKRALESIKTLTPSCSTTSSKGAGFSTYSRWYDSPEQPLFFTPIRISFGSGWETRSRSLDSAVGVSNTAAFLARSLLFRGFAFVSEGVASLLDTGCDFWASFSGKE